MRNRLLLIWVFCALFANFSYGQVQEGFIKGKVTDKTSGEGLGLANIMVMQNGVRKAAKQADFDGNYSIGPLSPGTYDIRVSYLGYQDKEIQGIQISSEKTQYVDVQMSLEGDGGLEQDVVEIVRFREPLVEQDNNTTSTTLTRDEILRAPVRNVAQLANISGGTYSANGGTPSIRGNKAGGTAYYIDGVRAFGSVLNIGTFALEQIDVISGGVPAEYGDANGGIIAVTTAGPSSRFAGGFEALTSQFLDPYGYNLFQGSISGPILKKKATEPNAVERSILGYFISGSLSHAKVSNTGAIPSYMVDDELLQDIQSKPLIRNPEGGGFINRGELVTLDDMTSTYVRPNTQALSYSVNTKLDFQPVENINFTFGGNYNYTNQNLFSYGNSLFNTENNPQLIDQGMRSFLRFRQTFNTGSEGIVKNAYYTIQVNYSATDRVTQSERHQDNFFDYGYIGKFDRYQEPVFITYPDTVNGKIVNKNHFVGWRDTATVFTPGDVNPVLQNYTTSFYSGMEELGLPVPNLPTIQTGQGLINGYAPLSIYSLWQAPGVPYNGYSHVDGNEFGLIANGSVTIGKRSDENTEDNKRGGEHKLKFGMQYEQRLERGYSISPMGLWTLARQLTNQHLSLGPLYPLYDEEGNVKDTFMRDWVPNYAEQSNFDRSLRDHLINTGATDERGNPITESSFINTDRLRPEDMDLSYFSANELLNNGNSYVGYNGYDYLGNKLDYRPSIDDFLDSTKRHVAPYNPIYLAGYVEDKFEFRDIIFRLGLRVDRFDANQPVLVDPYSLYPVRQVGEVQDINGQQISHPGNIGSDYLVYVDDALKPTEIVGYRTGNRWYDKNGAEVLNPEVLGLETSSGSIQPYLVNQEGVENQSQLQITRESFKDYEPQINIMPRVAFSFPISQEANFFANYDVLTQRPAANFATIDDYFYMQDRGTATLANPDLKPEKRINYEIGFKQKLTNVSALTIQAYYGEIRNLVQITNIIGAYPRNYATYNNIDFGTVKGMILTYDYRRIKTSGIQLQTFYTLQFAEGTSSGEGSAAALINAGQPNLRTIFPLDYDVRHQITSTIDYRFGQGPDYNSWTLNNGTRPLENIGLNLIFNVRSGTPYTQWARPIQTAMSGVANRPTIEGTVNGARLPWQFRADFRIDKFFNLTKQSDATLTSNGYKRNIGLNLYLNIQNVLNSKNVVYVYNYTGQADDDGFLSSIEGQRAISEATYSQAFEDQYRIKMHNPDNYINPRFIRIGAIVNF